MAARLTSRSIELRRAVVTGMGTVHPLGNDVGTSWKGALEGASGIRAIERFEVGDLPVRFAGQVRSVCHCREDSLRTFLLRLLS